MEDQLSSSWHELAAYTRMRKLAAAGTLRKEIIAAFAPLTKEQVVGALRTHRIRRSTPPLKPTGYPVIDAIHPVPGT
jgi:hypothetical protein